MERSANAHVRRCKKVVSGRLMRGKGRGRPRKNWRKMIRQDIHSTHRIHDPKYESMKIED